MTPSEVAIKYQEYRYIDHEKSYQFIKKESIPLDVYLKQKNLSFLNLSYIDGYKLFSFKELSTKIINNQANVIIEVTRPSFDSIKSEFFLNNIRSKGLSSVQIKEKLLNAKKEKINVSILLEKNSDGSWQVIP
jgi:hypothetical protein